MALPYYTAKTSHRDKNLFTSTILDSSGKQKRYFSSLDAEIYFGDTFIDDVVAIEYELSEEVMPIYGFNSPIFDHVAVGQRLVQGSFTVNFTKSGWIIECVNKLDSIFEGNLNYDANFKRTTGCGNILTPKLGGLFDIIVSFGDHRSKIQSTGSNAHLIKGVKILRFRQNFDASGEPISETYFFIASDMKFNIDSDSKGIDNSNFAGPATNKAKEEKSARSNLNIAYAGNKNQITKAQELADKNNDLSLSVICEHDYLVNDDTGSLSIIFKVLNNNINKEHLKINAISIIPTDKREAYVGLPNFKSNEFRYPLDNVKDVISVIKLKNGLEEFNSKIYKNFKKERNNAFIDAVITVEVEYMGTKTTVSNKAIRITPGTSYNF